MTFKSKCACEDGCTYPENPSSHRLSTGSILLIVWVWNNFTPDENNVEKSEQQKYPHSQKCHNTVKEQDKWLRRILEFQSTIHIPLLTLMRRLLAWSVCVCEFFSIQGYQDGLDFVSRNVPPHSRTILFHIRRYHRISDFLKYPIIKNAC